MWIVKSLNEWMNVEVAESFPYLGSLVQYLVDSVSEIKRSASIILECMLSLERSIWQSRISLGTKLRLY